MTDKVLPEERESYIHWDGSDDPATLCTNVPAVIKKMTAIWGAWPVHVREAHQREFL